MAGQVNRRSFMTMAAGAGAAMTMGAGATAQEAAKAAPKRYQEGISPWPFAMNTSTIRPASLQEKIQVTAAAGWDAIELWINDLEKYEKEGGDLKALAKEIQDLGMFVPNIIGLWNCMPPTAEEFEASLKATRERMRMSAAVGSEFVAAIPAPDRADFDVKWGAECYAKLMEIGRNDYNIKVAFEFVGFFKGVHRFGEASGVAIDSKDPAACLVMDTFHLFRGGSGFNNIKQIQGDFIANFHWNDVPGDKPREEQGDKDRILPGDGILPLTQILQDLKAIGFKRTLSLEIFNQKYYDMEAKAVAQLGLEKMRACVAAAKV